MSDIPVIRIDTSTAQTPCVEVFPEPDEAEEMLRWDRFIQWAERVLAIIGAGFLVLTLAAGAGYWWARHGERQWIEASKSKATISCGSCRRGGENPKPR